MDSTDLISQRAEARADSWRGLGRHTTARIALGRAGGSLRTTSLLDFRLSHAKARDAVLNPFDADRLASMLENCGVATLRLRTQAADRRGFLLRPDLGRTLHPDSRRELEALAPAWGRRDLALIVSDGLSALAAERHAPATLLALVERLAVQGWSHYPVFVAPFARVKVQDEIGECLGVRHSLILVGERPGLGSPDSLGAYFTYRPCATRTDADRNCLSNIRRGGLDPEIAAEKLASLLIESARLGLSGVGLKDLSLEPCALHLEQGRSVA